jgi:eukaryotic-like serine/threonine-protein kinase
MQDGNGPDTQVDRDGETWPATAPVEKIDPAASSLMRFKLGTMLGRGGMGEVISASDDVIGRRVAVKKMRGEKPSERAVARFLREARIQGRLEHPAIVPVHELQYDKDGFPFFVMKQVTGLTLSDILKRLTAKDDPGMAKRFSRRRLLEALADVCLAIEFAHTRGVVHRDLKPGNIILGEFGEVYVIDWGIAHVMAEGQEEFGDVHTFDDTSVMSEGMILGSPGYMSPEQIRHERDLDGRSDVYALGCILFEILTKESLHETGIAGIALALTGVETRPSVRRPDLDIPPELDIITMTALKQDKHERYASARTLHDSIQHFLDGDHDFAVRKELAAADIAGAKQCLSPNASPELRREATRAVARAIALDPTNTEAPALLARLMLEPPKHVPREVNEALERADDDALFAARRLIVFAAITYFAFIPILFVIGFDEPLFLGGCGAVAALMGVLAATARRDRVKLVGWIGLIGNSLMTLMFSYYATPFFVAPSLGVVTAMSIATHPRIAPAWVLVAVSATSVLAPLALELAGVIPRSMAVADNKLTMITHAHGLDLATTTIALTLYVVSLMAMSVILAKSLTSDRRKAQRLVQVQAWQLRQLVPG